MPYVHPMSRSGVLGYPLKTARVHEACGPSAASFALRFAAIGDGPVLWVQERWRPDRLNPTGFDGLDPARLIMALTKDQLETLGVMEEALRDGSMPVVIGVVTQPVSLIAGRRLQLAAAEGNTVGLSLIPEGMGSNATETRWRCTPVFAPHASDSTLQKWELIKNKSGTIGVWHVKWEAEARHVHVVPAPCDRPGAAPAPG